MVPPRRQPLSQHFLWNRRLVDRLVRASSISPHDLVLEIGAGRGLLTQALLQVAASVVAVELDDQLYRSLHKKLGHCPNLVLVQSDWLTLLIISAATSVPKIKRPDVSWTPCGVCFTAATCRNGEPSTAPSPGFKNNSGACIKSTAHALTRTGRNMAVMPLDLYPPPEYN